MSLPIFVGYLCRAMRCVASAAALVSASILVGQAALAHAHAKKRARVWEIFLVLKRLLVCLCACVLVCVCVCVCVCACARGVCGVRQGGGCTHAI
jgi:hypothetical protein